MTQKIENIEISGSSIKSILKKYKDRPEQAIAEFVWNGFDANATEVCIDFEEESVLGGLKKIIISDNGDGIPQELLGQKFKPFLESKKAASNNKNHSRTHGKNGIGRLTFFTFAKTATWTTRFSDKETIFEYDIEITSQDLKSYTGSNTQLRVSDKDFTGTSVIFEEIADELTKPILTGLITDYLKQEFGWFIELFKAKGLLLKIDGKELTYESIIGERDEIKITCAEGNVDFDMSFIRWNENLQKEFSKFYLINSNDEEVYKDTTKLNKQGDDFYHSVYIKSSFFDDFAYDKEGADDQKPLLGKSKNSAEYKFFEKELINYLRRKRRPFLEESADKLIDDYEKQGIIPKFSDDEWELVKKTELESLVRSLYQIQPKLFSKCNKEQKKIFVRFLNVILGSEERDQILAIVSEIVDLDREEKMQLLELLKSTKLSAIIRTIKLITDRYLIVDQIKQLVFDENLGANERDHLQKMIDENYWLFGEQFHLVTSTEAKFEMALREYQHLLTGVDEKTAMEHPDKNGEMDIFLCRQNKLSDTIENVVLELKSPWIGLGEHEVSQIKKYMRVILSEDRFNGDKTYWDFILVGNKFNTSGYIEGELRNAEQHGERSRGLIFKGDKYKIYARKWSDIFSDFECRHKFLQEKLELKRDELSKEYTSADEILRSRNGK
jgi:hypothetical protein